MDTKRASWDF
ncbi:hypothetical protein M8C21_025533 [Ambrosia artemisiifolia]|uniref:Uncharacterized protein n=1 Tax=Ambrosia artemisiifolia TaxID=4212 RepID=A0AAD5GHB6_AMBAR|nr:hypothetical protein M8C21_025533 [Ambrosia artemisiifolia]